MKTKIEIKSIFGKLLFEFECENNSINNTVSEAIKSGADLRGADLSDADLSDANLRSACLRGANLRSACLRGANLSDADLRSADLRGADLRSADLRGADLSDADLSDANLRSACLRGANLRSACLRGANLSDADLRSADLRGANLRSACLSDVSINETTSFFTISCPEEGSFIAFKKADNKIVKLLVCEDAKRSSATSLKCRCSKAKVLAIENLDGTISNLKEVTSNYKSDFIYKIGETKEVVNFDENRWNECSTGIHFFMSREQAKQY